MTKVSLGLQWDLVQVLNSVKENKPIFNIVRLFLLCLTDSHFFRNCANICMKTHVQLLSILSHLWLLMLSPRIL